MTIYSNFVELDVDKLQFENRTTIHNVIAANEHYLAINRYLGIIDFYDT